MELQIRSLVADIKGHSVLSGIDLDVSEGVTALVGRNGAGKTSLMRVVTGAISPSTGTVVRDGHDIFGGHAAMREHFRSLGWLPQEPRLPSHMTVQDMVSYAGWLKNIQGVSLDKAVNAAMTFSSVAEVRSQRLGRLSGGQRRSAALAAALVGNPRLILLDEPTSSLDPIQREILMGRVRQLGMQGNAVLLATHILEDVALSADRWVVMDHGVAVGFGDVSRASAEATATSLAQIRTAIATEWL